MRNTVLLAACLLVSTAACDDRFSRHPVLHVGAELPAYEARALDGTPVSLESLRGKVVLMAVWAAWCGPCIAEFPALEALHREFRDTDLVVLGVNIDPYPPHRVREILDRHEVTYPAAQDRMENLQRTFRWSRALPQSLLIDRSGRVALYWKGALDPANAAQHAAMADTIRALLAAPGPPP